jgi:hypothetical protein
MRVKQLGGISPEVEVRAKSFASKYALVCKAVLFAAFISVAAPAAVHAISPLTQGFLSSENLSPGSIVVLQKNSSDQVSAATTANVSNILGVVTNSDNSLLTLSNGQSNQIQVATSGIVQVLVSDINGGIATGDQITASPISGVGMKATDNVKVVGIAQGDLVKSKEGAQSYTDKQGKKHPVQIGQIPVLISVSYFYKQPDKTIIPSAIQNVANALAGKKVSSLPILISAAIFLVTLIVVVSIIYSMIHSSIISVGRNPMSQSAIYRDLVQMSALVLVILGVAFLSIYMILTKF